MHTLAEYATYQHEAPTDSPFLAREGDQGARYSELPVKQHDHALDATRYALHTALGPARQARSATAYVAAYLAKWRRE